MNLHEQATHLRLRKACEPWGAVVYPKVRVADVLPIERSGLDHEHYGFALKSHFDFVVTDSEHDPLFAVEFDGPQHKDPANVGRDTLKGELCDRFAFPILRINARYFPRKYRNMDLLSWFVEVWFSDRAFTEAQKFGGIPWDEGFDPASILAIPGMEGRFPLWLSLDARAEIQRLSKQGQCVQVRGIGFSRYETVTLRFISVAQQQQVSATTSTDSSGTYSYLFCSTITTPLGTWQVSAVDNRTGVGSGSQYFQITAAPALTVRAAPPRGPRGTAFFLTGENFTTNDAAIAHVAAPNQQEAITARQTTSASGTLQLTFQTGPMTALGVYQFWADDIFTRRTSDKASFEVVADQAGPPGDFILSVTQLCAGTAPNIILTWTPSSNASTYTVRRLLDTWQVVATITAPTTTFTDTMVPPNRSVSYDVQASNAAGTRTANSLTLTTSSCTVGTGTILVRALLDGIAWTGPVDIYLSKRDSNNQTIYNGQINLPASLGSQSVGIYQLSRNSGGPSGATFNGISPDPVQTVTAMATITYTLNFETTGNVQPLSVGIQSLPNGTVNQSYSAQLSAAGGASPFTWAASGLPDGLTLNSLSGAISGAPTRRGTYAVTITVTDARGTTAQKTFNVTISYAVALYIFTQSLSTGTVGTPYFQTITAVGGADRNYRWTYAGSLPPGLSFSRASCDLPTGACGAVLQGTPTTAGSYTFAATVTDGDGNQAQYQYTVVINQGASDLRITTSSLPTATVGQSYSASLIAGGGTGSGYSWSLIGGAFPTGLTLSSSGTISGIPTSTNDCSSSLSTHFTARVTDSGQNSATKDLCVSALPASPHVDSVSPSFLVLDGQAHTVTVRGKNFTNTSLLFIGGSVPTTYVDQSTLQTSFTYLSNGRFQTAAGVPFPASTYTLFVTTLGTPSNEVDFAIYNPPPTLSLVSAVQDNGSACRVNMTCHLVIDGGGFMSDTSVSSSAISGLNVQTYPSSLPGMRLISTSFTIHTAGTYSVTVSNSTTAPGTTSQVTAMFVINP